MQFWKKFTSSTMSSRSIGRGICPKCGQEGTIYIRRVGNREYIYFKHGKKWCYIGPKDSVNILAYLPDINAQLASTCTRNVNSAVAQSQSATVYVAASTPQSQSTARSRTKAVSIIKVMSVVLGVAIIVIIATLFALANIWDNSKNGNCDKLVEAKLYLKNMTFILPVVTKRGTVVYKVFKVRFKTFVEPLNESTIQTLLNRGNKQYVDCRCR